MRMLGSSRLTLTSDATFQVGPPSRSVPLQRSLADRPTDPFPRPATTTIHCRRPTPGNAPSGADAREQLRSNDQGRSHRVTCTCGTELSSDSCLAIRDEALPFAGGHVDNGFVSFWDMERDGGRFRTPVN